MSIFSGFNNWFGKKAFSYGLKSLSKVSRDRSHPEKYKARDALQANLDASALRTNNDIVAAYVKAKKKGVVGTGFTLQYKSPDNILNEKVEAWLSHWSEYGNCEITGKFFRQQLERYLVSEAAVVGGFIIRHHWDKKLNTLYKMEVISTMNIDRTKNDFAKGLYHGVQTNKFGQISGIHIYDNGERMSSTLNKMKDLILFIDIWTDPHQYTNVTPLAPILNTLDRLATYDKAEVTGAEKRANHSVIIATETYAIMLQAQTEYIQTFKVDSPERKVAEEQYMEMLAGFSAPGIPDGTTAIMPGDNTKVWDLKTSGDTIYADINLNSKQVISKAMGLSASTIAGVPESSYNVALKNQQEDESEYAIDGQMLVEICLKASYRKAVEAGYLLGFYDISDFYTKKLMYDSYLKITRKQKGHIDPLKQNLGDASSVESNFSSNVEVIANRGKDYIDVIKDNIKFEIERKEQYEAAGLIYIQTGTESIALAKAKVAATEQDEEESKSKDEVE